MNHSYFVISNEAQRCEKSVNLISKYGSFFGLSSIPDLSVALSSFEMTGKAGIQSSGKSMQMTKVCFSTRYTRYRIVFGSSKLQFVRIWAVE